MSGNAGGWLWLVVDVAFVAALAAGMAFALALWAGDARTPAAVAARDAATRRGYDAADREAS